MPITPKQLADKLRYAGEKVESMKRRAEFNDYHERKMYMITMVVEGRRPLFGKVIGDPTIASDKPGGPRIELSELGLRVKAQWEGIPKFRPEIQVEFLQIMPDHIHGILFVKRHMNQHLGTVLNGFKIGCGRAYRELFGDPVSCEESSASTLSVSKHDSSANQTSKQPRSKHGMLFEIGYNDKILYGEGELRRWIHYLKDNPRRLLIKRFHPDLFKVVSELKIAGRTFAAIGNRFLLESPTRMQVRCHNNTSDYNQKLIGKQKDYFQSRGAEGGVVVSPCISAGEKLIARTALDAHQPLIVILENGFPPIYKPPGKYFDACAEGLLLMLAPWPYHQEKRKITRWQCMELNQIAAEISTEPWTDELEAWLMKT